MIFDNDINYIFTRKSFKRLEKFYNETVKLSKPVDIKRSAELLYYREQLNEESKKLEIKILVTDKRINIFYVIEKDLENKERFIKE